ncbi:MAG: DNA polymerase III subunit beta [Candidatus Absconditabacteria bacterium]
MKLTVKLSYLQEVMELVFRYVSKHSTLPVLENIYIRGNIDSVIFRATDMEKYIDVEIPASIEMEGAITINAKTLYDIVKTIEEEDVVFILDENNDTVLLRNGTDEYKIKGISASEYVAVPEFVGNTTIKIPANQFSKGIEKVEYAVTDRNFSPVLTGVLMRLKNTTKGNKLIFVGTDSFRLSEYRVDFDGNFDPVSIIIPKLNVADIKKVSDFFVSKGGEDLEMNIADNLVSFSFKLDSFKIITTSLLIQGNFPEYENENIIPTVFNSKVILNKSDLDKAIRKISILTRDINNFIDISIGENVLSLKSGETDRGEGKTQLSAYVEGEQINFGINGKYVQDYIKSIEAEEMTLNVVNAERPIVFKNINDDNYTYIIRPLVK